MKLLFDANVSWKLTRMLADEFPGCLHVDLVGLPIPPKDLEIWNYNL